MRGCLTVSSLLSSQLTILLTCSSFLHTLTLTSPNTTSPSNTDHTPSTLTEGDQISEAMKRLSVSEPSSNDGHADILRAFLSSPNLTCLCLRQALQLVCISSHHSLPSTADADVSLVVGLLGTVSQFLPRHSDIDLSPVGVPPLATPTALLPGSRGRGHGRRPAAGKECIVGSMSVSSVRLVGVAIELACARARYLLARKEPVLTQQLLRAALEKAEGFEQQGYQFSLLRAKLHHYMGVALAQQLEDEAACDGEVWFKDTGGCVHQHCLDQFLCSYQLCFPVLPTILLRETCLWLALLLADSEQSHHFLALSQHISLSHQTLLSLGKKIRLATICVQPTIFLTLLLCVCV